MSRVTAPFALALATALTTLIVFESRAEGHATGVEQVAPQPPGSPQLNPQQVSSNPVVLSWTPGSGGTPTSYTLQAGTAPGASDLAVFSVGMGTTITANAPLGLRLYVRIIASNEHGSATSNEIDFTVGSPMAPGPPILRAPQVPVTNPVTLTWSPGPGGSPTRYQLVVRQSQSLPEPHIFLLGTVDMGLATSATGTVQPFNQYLVSVVAENASGVATSNEVGVYVATPTPAAPVVHAPVVNGSTVHLTWSGPSGAQYTLMVRLAENGPVFMYIPVGTVTSIDATGVGSGSYYVSAVATVEGATSLNSNQVSIVVP